MATSNIHSFGSSSVSPSISSPSESSSSVSYTSSALSTSSVLSTSAATVHENHSSTSSHGAAVPLFTTISHETAVFAHAVNDHERLTIALADRTINFFEADIITVLPLSSSSLSFSSSSLALPPYPSPNDNDDEEIKGSKGAGTKPISPPSSSCKVVMGHTSGDPYDLTVEEWIKLMLNNGRGIKLDIKEYNAVPEILDILGKYEGKHNEKKTPTETNTSLSSSSSPSINPSNDDNIIRNENGPGTVTSNWPLFRIQKIIHSSSPISASFDIPAIVINADILTGTTLPLGAAPGCLFNPYRKVLSNEEQIYYGKLFIEKIIETLPLAILSPGWTTAGEYRSYTYDMIQSMVQVIHEYAEAGIPITFPVRGTYIQSSYPLLKKYLLDPYCATSLTVWSNVLLSETEEEWLRTNLDPQRTMYDLVPRSPYQPGAKAALSIQQTLAKRITWKSYLLSKLKSTIADIWSQLLDNGILSSIDNSLNTKVLLTSSPVKAGLLVSSIIGLSLIGYNRYMQGRN